ncbi:hypothetical protein IAQ61_008686 [Plenodomus lingam]|uniref:uncharacterized protein n=1 Tax=Leptosphaeria maculans TaxID=5022 RepID=UPI00332D16CF|nr:hypothetical protein IAQ61_008686 [Plenodomus lingam]
MLSKVVLARRRTRTGWLDERTNEEERRILELRGRGSRRLLWGEKTSVNRLGLAVLGTGFDNGAIVCRSVLAIMPHNLPYTNPKPQTKKHTYSPYINLALDRHHMQTCIQEDIPIQPQHTQTISAKKQPQYFRKYTRHVVYGLPLLCILQPHSPPPEKKSDKPQSKPQSRAQKTTTTSPP